MDERLVGTKPKSLSLHWELMFARSMFNAADISEQGQLLSRVADKIDLVKTEPSKLVDITRAEEGCTNYDLHQNNANPAHFLFYENWLSRELWQADIETTLHSHTHREYVGRRELSKLNPVTGNVLVAKTA